ncbi:MAG: carboxypeptidase regulatory-like domain-containing protein, partial [Bacteroidetes bacterium]|nr:carboxypeptidase regulatory-like domain-containing protein [Bacteroidota bacterium]
MKRLLILLALAIVVYSCSEDEKEIIPDCTPGAVCDDGNANTSGDKYDADCVCVGTPNTGFDLGSNIQRDVAGRIFNEAGQPLEGVTVSVGSKTATTDELGVFRINNATVKENL